MFILSTINWNNNFLMFPERHQKKFISFTEAELDFFFFWYFSFAGVHRNDQVNLEDMWKVDALRLT